MQWAGEGEMTQGRRRRGGWAALGCPSSPPGGRPSCAVVLQPIKSGGNRGWACVQVCTRALWPCSECPPAGLQPWDKRLRCQHRVKRCEGEVVAPQLKVLPSPPLDLSPAGILGAEPVATAALPHGKKVHPHFPLAAGMLTCPGGSVTGKQSGNSEYLP